MKISQISNQGSSSREGLPPLQGMILDEIRRRSDEVFVSDDEGLLQAFPRLKRSALSWSLWSLYRRGLLGKAKVRIGGRQRVVFGSPEAIRQLDAHLGRGPASSAPSPEEGPQDEPPPEAAQSGGVRWDD